ncbi:MAG: hypothetical protein ACLVIU_06235 [Paraclostridium sp.]
MRKKLGSIMVTTLFCFSILSILCLSCLDIIRSNNDIISVYEESLNLQYKVKGGLNLAHSKILEEVDKAIKIAIKDEYPEDKYKDYFLGSNKINFIKSIESLDCENIILDVINNKIYIEDNYIKLDITCSKSNKEIKKSVRCSFKISMNIEDINKNKVYKYNYKEI